MDSLTNCIICHHKCKPFVSNPGYEVFKCESCGLGEVKRKSWESVTQYHRDEDYFTNQSLYTNILEKIFKRVALQFNKPGKLLEIGCSVGTALTIWQNHGWRVWGIEPSISAAALAKKAGFRVVAKELERAPIPKDFFDVVMANHTLEHCSDPRKFVELSVKACKRNGIVVFGVPNFSSWSAELQKEKWPQLLPREHRWQFSMNALQELCSQNNLRTVDRWTDSGLWGMARPAEEIRQAIFARKKRVFGELINLPWHTWETLTNRGSNLVIVAQKT